MNKLCPYCKKEIDNNTLFCPHCKLQITEHHSPIYNNTIPDIPVSTRSMSPSIHHRKSKNKWISLLLCIFTVVGHKFYEGKIGMGFLYLFTAGLFGIGWLVDIIILITKPNPYYV